MEDVMEKVNREKINWSKAKEIAVWVAAVFFVVAGGLHFISPLVTRNFSEPTTEHDIRAIVRDEFTTYQTNLQILLVVGGAGLAFFGVVLPKKEVQENKAEAENLKAQAENLKTLVEQHHKTTEAKIFEVSKKVDQAKKSLGPQKDLDAQSDDEIATELIKANDKFNEAYRTSCLSEREIKFNDAMQLYMTAHESCKTAREKAKLDDDSIAIHRKQLLHAKIHSGQARIHWHLKEYLKSLDQATRAIRLSEQYKDDDERASSRYYYQRGIAFRELTCYCEALSDLSKAISMDDRNHRLAGYYCGRAAVLCGLGHYEEALADDNMAIDLCDKASETTSQSLFFASLISPNETPEEKIVRNEKVNKLKEDKQILKKQLEDYKASKKVTEELIKQHEGATS